MSVIKRCCVCDGLIVDGRCSWCGMPYRDEEGRYHLNENLRDHLAHMSEKERQEYFRRQQSMYTQPGQQTPPPQQMPPRQPSYAGSSGNGRPPYRPGSASGPGSSGMPPFYGKPPAQPQQKKNGLAGFFVFLFILLCVIIPMLQAFFE
jgi:hypothetical protein